MIPTHTIGQGGVRLVALETAGFSVDETRYPRDLELPAHQHELANLCIVLDGALTENVLRQERLCEAATLIAKPPGAVHSDRFQRTGARCLNISVSRERLARIREAIPALADVYFDLNSSLVALARCVSNELREGDDLSPIAVEGLVLELISGTIRASRREMDRVPDWVREVRDYLHDNFTSSVGLSDVAAAIGRHPTRVAQQFHRRYGVSIGEYVRRIRVEQVARRLGSGREPLSRIAAEAGFADQSHMHRVFKARMGVTPAAYRRAHA